MMIKRLVSIVALLCLPCGVVHAQEYSRKQLQFWRLERYGQVDAPSAIYEVVQSKHRLNELWNAIYGRSLNYGAAPAIDFKKDVVIVLTPGAKTTGGYSIKATQVLDDGARVVVEVERSSPGPACIVTMAFMTPIDIIRLPKPKRPVEFSFRDSATECR